MFLLFLTFSIQLCNCWILSVESGVESVQLSFITTADLPRDIRVEWKDWKNWKVHVYQDGSDRPEEQHRFYRNRTEMKKDLLRPGDLSLTLKPPRYRGTYTCRVYREGRVLRGKVVKLNITGQFKFSIFVISSGSNMRRCFSSDGYYRNRTEMKKDLLRTGDLSLTLKHPTVRGTFTCRVYRERRVLMEKQVELWVTGLFFFGCVFVSGCLSLTVFCLLCR
uniref:Ig-like domain-containing protein n=1 Tax=Mastacembelus armatus TaxID=205130 RepID=A0A3Q3LY29_9TELE